MTKTKDGRFKEKRIKLPKKLQKKLILEAKNHNNLTWDQLSKKLDCSTYTLSHGWLNSTVTLPESVAKELVKIHPTLTWKKLLESGEILNPFWGQRIGPRTGRRYSKSIIEPKLNKEYAELYGAMLGDGCIYSNKSGICITCDSLVDREYITKRISELIQKSFGQEPKLYYSNRERKIRCVLYSKKACEYLEKQGFPLGKKNATNLVMPKEFFSDSELLRACLRGIYDTDGSIYPHPHSKVVIEFSCKNKSLLTSIKKGLVRLEIECGGSHDRAHLYGAKKAKIFFEKIESSNPKHIFKYNYFLDKGWVPQAKEVEAFLSSNTQQ